MLDTAACRRSSLSPCPLSRYDTRLPQGLVQKVAEVAKMLDVKGLSFVCRHSLLKHRDPVLTLYQTGGTICACPRPCIHNMTSQ